MNVNVMPFVIAQQFRCHARMIENVSDKLGQSQTVHVQDLTE